MQRISALPISARNRSDCSAVIFIACCSPIRSKPHLPTRRIMDDRTVRPLPPLRRERQFAPETMGKIGDVARPLTFIERLTNMTLVRRHVVILVLAAAWEIYARILDNPLLFP